MSAEATHKQKFVNHHTRLHKTRKRSFKTKTVYVYPSVDHRQVVMWRDVGPWVQLMWSKQADRGYATALPVCSVRACLWQRTDWVEQKGASRRFCSVQWSSLHFPSTAEILENCTRLYPPAPTFTGGLPPWDWRLFRSNAVSLDWINFCVFRT